MAAAAPAEAEAIINEEYKVWKKNAPFLYDIVMSHALDWPSLTVDWLPSKDPVDGEDYSEHKVVLGTHTADNEQNMLIVAKVRLPNEDAEIDARKYDEQEGELGGYGGLVGKVEKVVRMNHEGEVNRARHCPQNEFLIATKGPHGDVLVFDYSKHPSAPKSGDDECKPQMRLTGHTAEGYGLSWSTLRPGYLLSGSDDKMACVWDTAATPNSDGKIEPISTFAAHGDVVEDVAWSRHHQHLFGSVSDDKHLYLWDIRAGDKPTQAVQAHEAELNSLSFNPFQEHLLLTASSDKLVALWDSRKLGQSLHTFKAHTDEVFSVQWAPFKESVFASSGSDRRLNVWDTSRIGAEQDPEDAEDGPPELLVRSTHLAFAVCRPDTFLCSHVSQFVHGGHTAKVSDFSWELNQDWVVASVAEDNILQVWQLADAIVHDGEDEDAEEPADDDLE